MKQKFPYPRPVLAKADAGDGFVVVVDGVSLRRQVVMVYLTSRAVENTINMGSCCKRETSETHMSMK